MPSFSFLISYSLYAVTVRLAVSIAFVTIPESCFERLHAEIKTDEAFATSSMIDWAQGMSVYTDFAVNLKPGLCLDTIETLCQALEDDSFADVDIATNLDALLTTDKQGIYAIVTYSPLVFEYMLYIGSFYGDSGLVIHIKSHCSAVYRESQPAKAVHRHCGSKNCFFKLLEFDNHVERELVLFVESCFQRGIGSRYSRDEKNVLPRLSHGAYAPLNGSDPIAEGEESSIGMQKALFSRISKLETTQRNEPTPIYCSKYDHREPTFRLRVFDIMLSLPIGICRDWSLADNFESKTGLLTTWSLNCTATQRWAVRSQPSDDCYTFGVMISKVISNNLETHWLRNDGPMAHKFAKTFFYFPERPYRWQGLCLGGQSRQPFRSSKGVRRRRPYKGRSQALVTNPSRAFRFEQSQHHQAGPQYLLSPGLSPGLSPAATPSPR